MRMALILAIVFLVFGVAAGQVNNEVSRDLVLDNNFVHVERVTLPSGSALKFRTQGDSVVVHRSGEAEFMKSGTEISLTNAANPPATEFLVRLKKHWEIPIHACREPMKCTRETQMGGEPVAWTTTLFTNGFLTASRHRVVPGGTLTSSYYSAKGKDHILLIPFTDLSANFGGTPEDLKANQPYFSSVTEIEITGGKKEARWFVLRIHIS